MVHNNMEILEMERKSYRGGRSEAFRLGKFKEIYYLDINSMYPFVMKYNIYPTKLIYKKPLKDMTVRDIIDGIKNNVGGMYDCSLQMNEPVIGIRRDKLIFPIGRFRQIITYPEMKYILDNPESGDIVKIHSVVNYELRNIFNDYVDYFYNDVRLNATNDADKKMAKLFLNSLYGKFGQHKSSIPRLVTDELELKVCNDIMSATNTLEYHTGVGEKYTRLGDKIYHIIQNDGDFGTDSIPIISSFVTSYSRILLWDMINKADLTNVYYCDTDSLFVNYKGYKNLEQYISQTELGKLKLEKVGNCQTHGVKDYVFGDIIKLKGVKKNAKKIGPNTYVQEQFRTGNKRYTTGTPDGIIIVEPVTKTISRKYDKGIVEKNKVKPFSLKEF